MRKLIVGILMAVLLLLGCSEKAEPTPEDTLQVVDVSILTKEELALGETLLQAKVTLKDEPVNDAEEVIFEIWQSGKREDSIKINGQLSKDGQYEATHVFNEDGVYYMFAHTTARGYHVMPKQKLIVGSPDMSKVLEDHSGHSMDDSEEKDHDEH